MHDPKRSSVNRRSEDRFVPCLEEVLWRRDGATCRSRRGCVRDVSDGGVSIVTGRHSDLKVGSLLRVLSPSTEECATCEVKWIEAGGPLAAIGCKLVASNSVPAKIDPLPLAKPATAALSPPCAE